MITDLEYFDYSINNELLTSDLSLSDNINEIPINGIYLKNTFNNNNHLTSTSNLNNNNNNKNLINQNSITKKRQLRINKSSQKTRKKIKIKLNFMETHITNIQQLITKIHNCVQIIDIPNLILHIENANKEIKNYNENLIEELKKI